MASTHGYGTRSKDKKDDKAKKKKFTPKKATKGDETKGTPTISPVPKLEKDSKLDFWQMAHSAIMEYEEDQGSFVRLMQALELLRPSRLSITKLRKMEKKVSGDSEVTDDVFKAVLESDSFGAEGYNTRDWMHAIKKYYGPEDKVKVESAERKAGVDAYRSKVGQLSKVTLDLPKYTGRRGYCGLWWEKVQTKLQNHTNHRGPSPRQWSSTIGSYIKAAGASSRYENLLKDLNDSMD
mmetsp:Transcript_5996/g.8967  ORF Transcript_5996/g.8967 Transcript_5996/m.8967 type:complete len:237 (+) Transcript_5996:344-1054(+)